MSGDEIMTFEEAMSILRHGSEKRKRKYYEAINFIEKEYNRQLADIEKLENIERLADKLIKAQQSEIQRLGLDVMQAGRRREIAIKEFWKKFDEALLQNIGPSRRLYWRILEAGNNLVAEMTEVSEK